MLNSDSDVTGNLGMSGQSSLRLACNIIYGEACKATVDTGAKMLRKMEREVDKEPIIKSIVIHSCHDCSLMYARSVFWEPVPYKVGHERGGRDGEWKYAVLVMWAQPTPSTH